MPRWCAVLQEWERLDDERPVPDADGFYYLVEMMTTRTFQALLVTAAVFFLPAASLHAQSGAAGDMLTYRHPDGSLQPVTTVQWWEVKRHQVLARMQLAMGRLPDRRHPVPLQVRVKDSLLQRNHIRYEITFMAAENEPVPALLFVPLKKGKHAAVLALHSTSPLGKKAITSENTGKANRAYAEELADRGYVVIAPDYPSFGDLADHDFDRDRYASGTMKAIFNHMRCIDLLQAREDVDTAHIGVIGHSLGGHNAMFVAAFDQRIKVIVASCGWTLFSYYNIGEAASKHYGGRLGPWAQARYMPLLRDGYGLDPKRVPFDFDEVIATLAPRPFYSNAPLHDSNFDVQGVKAGIAHAAPVYDLFNATQQLQVRYPEAEHDFPPAQRLEAYRFMDRALHHTPEAHVLLP
ncbi:alpha/beta hydrolase [Chitinophaga alhagiae]|uniref:alpha/beta hydrolase n=1 Tax=Chitinophaga alhagiae TaxID=2203219 RepID=UPI0018E57724|nr:alpha/beta fold hydrolase [Chitinophaga alhagiae]